MPRKNTSKDGKWTPYGSSPDRAEAVKQGKRPGTARFDFNYTPKKIFIGKRQRR
jgi:hypothetical protein